MLDKRNRCTRLLLNLLELLTLAEFSGQKITDCNDMSVRRESIVDTERQNSIERVDSSSGREYGTFTEAHWYSRDTNENSEDPWAISTLVVDTIPWHELTLREKATRVSLEYIFRPTSLLILFYIFLCGLDLLDSSMRLIGGKLTTSVFQKDDFYTNPVAAAMMGVLTTALVQSSTTSTSIVVSMVGTDLMTVETAIYVIMGCNVGTTETNTLVSLTQFADRKQFRRAFAGATIHDVFNWLSLFVLLPFEWATGYLNKLSDAIVHELPVSTLVWADSMYWKQIVKPVTKYIIEVDSETITEIALNETSPETSLIKTECGDGNITMPCKFMFMNVAGKWKDWQIGVILLLMTIVLLSVCLYLSVKILNKIFSGYFAVSFKKFVNSDFPGYGKYFTGYVAIFIGAILTILLTSSSVFTSALTPIAGIGVITIDRMYPLTIGANIGTTLTAILASLGHDAQFLTNALQASLCHLFFNLSGMLLWYPIPYTRSLPVFVAKGLGTTSAKYRWFAVLYILLTFYTLPLLILGLNCAGDWVLGGVLIPTIIILFIIIIINVIQNKKPQILPNKLRNWNFLPLWCHSLKPLDDVISKVLQKTKTLYGKFRTSKDGTT